MGAWGLQFDENDDAADWLGEFSDDPSWDAVDRAFGAVADTGSYLEAPECSQAIAAAEVVAACVGRSSPRLEPEIAAWAQANRADAASRRELAGKLLNRIRDDSELQELWAEGGDSSDWQATIADLKMRLEL